MKPTFFAPREALDMKPAHGAPCNNCGLCCYATVCDLGRHVLKQEAGPCPALIMDGGRSRCGLVEKPMTHAMARTLEHGEVSMSAAAAVLVGSGTGCDARFNGEWINEPFYDVLREWDRRNAVKIKRAKALWGIK